MVETDYSRLLRRQLVMLPKLTSTLQGWAISSHCCVQPFMSVTHAVFFLCVPGWTPRTPASVVVSDWPSAGWHLRCYFKRTSCRRRLWNCCALRSSCNQLPSPLLSQFLVGSCVSMTSRVSLTVFCFRTPLVGFLRFLKLLSSHDWAETPLCVNLNKEFTSEFFHQIINLWSVSPPLSGAHVLWAYVVSIAEDSYTEIHNHFTQNRKDLPLMFIATPTEPTSSPWTIHGPSAPILNRLALLAQESLSLLEHQLQTTDAEFKVGGSWHDFPLRSNFSRCFSISFRPSSGLPWAFTMLWSHWSLGSLPARSWEWTPSISVLCLRRRLPVPACQWSTLTLLSCT